MKRLFFVLIWIVVSSVLCVGQNTIYFPQVADGQAGGFAWTTIILVANAAASGSVAANGTVTFTKDNGSAFNVQFTDLAGQTVGSGNTIPFQLSGGQSRFYVSTGTAALTSGFATVTSDLPISATAIFKEFSVATGAGIGSAGVAPATPLTNQSIFFYEAGNSDTGVALANTSSNASTVTLQLLNSDGSQALPAVTISLAGNSHTSQFLSQLFPNSLGLYGTIQMTSQAPIVATALYFNDDGTFFTAPVVAPNLVFNTWGELKERRLSARTGAAVGLE